MFLCWILQAEANGHALQGQDEVDGSLDVEDDDVPDGLDMPDAAALKKRFNLCKAGESNWQNICEHFASNYMTLEKHTFDNARITRDDKYYSSKLGELVRERFLIHLASESNYFKSSHCTSKFS